MNTLAICALSLALIAPAVGHAASSSSVDTVGDASAVRVSYRDLDLNQPRDAHILLTRIHQAALESCGASAFSLREYRQAVQHSACYANSTERAVAAVNMPVVSGVAEGAR